MGAAAGGIPSSPGPGLRRASWCFPDGDAAQSRFGGKRRPRIVFEGNSSFEPVVSNMTLLTYRRRSNILFADTKDIDGKAFGQIVVGELPEDEASRRSRMLAIILTERRVYTAERRSYGWLRRQPC